MCTEVNKLFLFVSLCFLLPSDLEALKMKVTRAG